MNKNNTSPEPHPRTGFALGLLAYALWGVLPIYFKLLAGVPAFDIVAHRVLWSLPFLAMLIVFSRGWSKLRDAVGVPRTLAILVVTAILIGGNWLLYVYAVTSGHILAASFGYYLNPLANVLLGRFVLHERLSPLDCGQLNASNGFCRQAGLDTGITHDAGRLDHAFGCRRVRTEHECIS